MSTCYKCGEYVADSGVITMGGAGASGLDNLAIWVNVAPHAASGGTMMPFHRRCAPGGEDAYKFVTEAECKRRIAAALQEQETELQQLRGRHSTTHAPSLERIKRAHTQMPLSTWAEDVTAQHRTYCQSEDEQCYLCALIILLEAAERRIAELEGRAP